MMVVRLARDHLPQQRLHLVQPASLFRKHGLVVDQIVVLRGEGNRFALQSVCLLILPAVLEQLHFRQKFQATFVCRTAR